MSSMTMENIMISTETEVMHITITEHTITEQPYHDMSGEERQQLVNDFITEINKQIMKEFVVDKSETVKIQPSFLVTYNPGV